MGMMREQFYSDQNEIFTPSIWMLHIRYIGYAFLGGSLFLTYRSIPTILTSDSKVKLEKPIMLAIHLAILVVLSVELKHIAILQNIENMLTVSDRIERIGFSILWGAYGLFLMSMGFWKKKSYLRLGAIGLLGLTLLKVFIYDMADSSVGNKVIVFVSLGILLLITAFLYQKYKHIIESEEGDVVEETVGLEE